MEYTEVEERIRAIVPDAEIEVQGKDCDFNLTIISQKFEGMKTMSRQQLVLSVFADELASGKLHALSVKTYTLDEWNKRSAGLVNITLEKK